ncbi:MAG: hypothetical protein WD472_06835 [Dehalococcoidia bacterium]
MFDPDDIDAPDIFGGLGRDAMKVVGPLALLLFAPSLLAARRSEIDAVRTQTGCFDAEAYNLRATKGDSRKEAG